MTSVVPDVRAFNRFYTRVLGLLKPDLAGSRFTLTEARILFEIAQFDTLPVSDLRAALDLDAGYLSRILANFATAGLIVREPSSADRRRQSVRLTDAGRTAFAELDELQTAAIDDMLAPLSTDQRTRIATAMARIRQTLGDAPRPAALVLRSPEPGDLGWVVERHGRRYADDYGWDTTFEGLVAEIVGDFSRRTDGPPQAGWIAELDGERVGCVFCTAADEPDTAKLRLLLVEPSARGAGVGSRLVEECLRFAKRSGYTRITLWTNEILTAARRIYQRAGFRLDRSEPHHSFGHDLVGEYWSREL
ncbi:MarR family transcriptional regulator [Mycolicibacterium sp. S2-37]|uniref:bifunctional helix-turn-helix transcriptional regulator/GNAT family N-acetyltransferase n=1 Tax=Mycolicibacterium sp. S2-37 TaxID=2810297 RepID=UPI001A946B15|nr:bifunctional helix-turn-helix transcriptional regulator/GNAT family N-acetyltransferase [Mycolicibacterium sp. S2-37]MBO0678288.1 MarR family transcriptional regulator [Mycolicibacterium sp. S2-37]